MKALKVFENIYFERGEDPKKSMGIGKEARIREIKIFLSQFQNNYFGTASDVIRKDLKNRLDEIVSNSSIKKIPFDRKYLPFELSFGLREFEKKDYKMYELEYDLIFIYNRMFNTQGYLVNKNQQIISTSGESSVGRETIKKLINRVKLLK